MLEAAILLALIGASSLFAHNPTATWAAMAFAVLLFAQFTRLMLQMAPPFVPTRRSDVRRMVELAELRPGDRVYDLGCGDGRIVREAARRGALATGYELSVPTLLLAKALTSSTANATVRYGDFWKKDLRDADVIFCFLLKEPMRRFEETVWPTLKPGTRVVSYMFTMPRAVPAATDGRISVYVR